MKIPNLTPHHFRPVSELDYPTSRRQNTPASSVQLKYGDSQSMMDKKVQIGKNQKNIRGKFMNLFRLNELQDNKTTDPPVHLTENLKDLWQQIMDAANLAIENNRGKFIGGGKELQAEIKLKQEQLNQGILPKSEHKSFEKDLKKLMAKHIICNNQRAGKKSAGKYAATEAKRLYKNAVVLNLNDKPWKIIHNEFEHEGKKFHNIMTPAAGMKFSGHNVFETDYNGKGICSGTTNSKNHATNLWSSELKFTDAEGKEHRVINATRHGINSAYGLKGKKERETAALNRSKEVITAALFQQKPEQLRESMKTGAPVNLKLTSTSMVTAMDAFGQSEGKQMKDQVGAWNKLNAMSNAEGGIKLTIRDESGTLKQVTVKLEAAPLNFGVNEAALTQKISLGKLTLFKLDAGWKNADKVNEQGLKQVLGDDFNSGGNPGGWVGEYLEKNPSANNTKLVKELNAQICEIWDTKSHHTDKHKTADGKKSALGDPYKMAARIALLTQEIGAAPCYNCKSGKDRTGMMDSELKYLATHYHLHGNLPRPGSQFSATDQTLFHKTLLQTGNCEIQKQNTAAPGNKIFKNLDFNNLSIKDRVNDSEIFDQGKGLSSLVKS